MYDSKEKCKEIARKFKQLCDERGTTPYKIAHNTQMSSSTISCFLTGKTIPRMDTVMILCNELRVSVTDIFEEREMAEVQTEKEKTILQIYRNLSDEKRKSFMNYLKMLSQYKEE